MNFDSMKKYADGNFMHEFAVGMHRDKPEAVESAVCQCSCYIAQYA